MKLLQKIIENAWEDRAFLKEENTIKSIIKVIDLLDEGTLRVAELNSSSTAVNVERDGLDPIRVSIALN